jgi:aldehyde:ferredoxin oxidoreductase
MGFLTSVIVNQPRNQEALMKGWMGKILRVDLENRRISKLNTADYGEWVGGHGIGSAIVWELLKNPEIGGFDRRNVLTLMTSPLTGTLSPSTGRMELQGIGVQSYPVEWFTRSNIGGRFAAMLKFAGWDGIVLEGKADVPVWLDIRNHRVQIRDAQELWGLDTWETQARIFKEVTGDDNILRHWNEVEKGRWTTQQPAVLTIGPAGENRCRNACIIHERGHAFGQGGFGAVWGDKKLKAISAVGSNSVPVADPDALMKAWKDARKRYSQWPADPSTRFYNQFAPSKPAFEFWPVKREGRRKACFGCFYGCHAVYADGMGSEGKCYPTIMYQTQDRGKHGKLTEASFVAVDLINRYGLNAWEIGEGLTYVKSLYDEGDLGRGKRIDCDLSFEKYGEAEFVEAYLEQISKRRGIGADLAEGLPRAAKRWGRLEKDLETETLGLHFWGYPRHYDPRAHVDWGYGSIMGERDVNEHDINWLYWIASPMGLVPGGGGRNKPLVSAEEAVRIFSEKTVPYQGDLDMFDFSEENMYSDGIAKLVAWHRHFTRFWRQSALFCDFRWGPINLYAPGKKGALAEGEEPFFTAVTGRKVAIEEGVEIGRRIWNLDNAIWTLQGRHRDLVQFPEYIYQVPLANRGAISMPGKKNGKWTYIRANGRTLDKQGFEAWKTRFYRLEGWDPESGWPTRETLEGLNLSQVATRLEADNKLGES